MPTSITRFFISFTTQRQRHYRVNRISTQYSTLVVQILRIRETYKVQSRNVISQERRKREREREQKARVAVWLRSLTRDETTLYRPSNAHPNTDPPPWMTPSLPPKISRPGASSRPFLTPPSPLPGQSFAAESVSLDPNSIDRWRRRDLSPLSSLSLSPSFVADCSTRMIDGGPTSRKGTIEAVSSPFIRLYPIPPLMDDRDKRSRSWRHRARCTRRS